MTVYSDCSVNSTGDLELTLECVANWVENANKEQTSLSNSVDAADLTQWLLVVTGALVFFMQSGFAMLCAGAVRKKNVNNTMMKNLLDACGAAVAFYATGYAFAYGASPSGSNDISFIGSSNFFLKGDVDPAVFFFQFAFSATAVTIVAGTLAERCQMTSYLFYSFFLTGFVYPVVARIIWGNGYLSTANSNPWIGIGVVDFAGSAVVHMTGGFTALFATVVLGARQGRFYDSDGNPKATPGFTKGHSTALQLLGTLILWFGWYGFNPGSALLLGVDKKGAVAAHAAVTTTLAAATGAISGLITDGLIKRRRRGEFSMDLVMAMNGCLSGLVAITAGCAVVEFWASVVIGIVAGWIYVGGSALLIKVKIDDAVDAIPVHLFNGIWGIFAVGLLTSPQLLLQAYGTDSHPGFFYAPVESNLLGAQVVAIVFVMGWTFVTMFPFFLVLDYLGWFRVNALEELIGLDASYTHDNAPDRLFDDESDTDQEERLRAYQKRFEERKEIRGSRHGKKSVEDILNESWGVAEFGNSEDGRSFKSKNGMALDVGLDDAALPEQAPKANPKKPAAVTSTTLEL